jgi:hypothetical protein
MEYICLKIQNTLAKRVESGEVIPPADYAAAGANMMASLCNVTDAMHKYGQAAAKIKVQAMDEDMSAAKAEAVMEASDEYLKYKAMKSRVEQVDRLSSIAQTMSKAVTAEFIGNR